MLFLGFSRFFKIIHFHFHLPKTRPGRRHNEAHIATWPLKASWAAPGALWGGAWIACELGDGRAGGLKKRWLGVECWSFSDAVVDVFVRVFSCCSSLFAARGKGAHAEYIIKVMVFHDFSKLVKTAALRKDGPR